MEPIQPFRGFTAHVRPLGAFLQRATSSTSNLAYKKYMIVIVPEELAIIIEYAVPFLRWLQIKPFPVRELTILVFSWVWQLS